ncbi:hypothetical protein LTR53_014640, partial [Teratosphaeriaceae sp. CCFEE 6253]
PATTTAETSALFTYAPETSTAASSDLVGGYIGSVPLSSTPTSEAAVTTSAVPTGAAATSASVSQAFEYSPSSATGETSAIAATIISIGSSAVPIAAVPASSADGVSSVALTAYVIGSQTASVGQTITVDSTPVVLQTSAGVTQLYAGTDASGSALTFASATAAAASTPAPAVISVGSSAVSIVPVPQSYAPGASSSEPAAYVIGSQTASVGQTLTIDNTPVVIQTSAGVTQLYAGADTGSAMFSFAPTTAASTAPAIISVGTSAISIAPIPQSVTPGGSSSAAAFLIGTQTASVGQTVTIDNTPIVIQTSAGKTQLVAGTASPSALSFAQIAAAAPSALTGVPTTLVIGLQTVTRNAAGNYLLGSQTLVPGSSITQGSGSATAVIALATLSGSTQLVVQDALTTASTVLPKITAAASGSAPQQESSAIVVNGHTYFLGPASLNAQATDLPSGSGSSFVASGTGGAAKATGTGGAALQNGAGAASGWSVLLGGVTLVALGWLVLL